MFHHRWDRKLTQLPTGEVIKTLKVGGRTSVYVPSKQKLCTISEKDDIDINVDDVKIETKKKRKTDTAIDEKKKLKKRKKV